MRRRIVAILSAAALSTAALGAAAIVPESATAAGTTTVEVPQQACGPARPGHVTCASVRLVKERVPAERAAEMRTAGLARPAIQPALTSGPVGGYSPAQLAKAYGVNRNAASTPTVAIVSPYNAPNVVADTNTFDRKYGLAEETSTSLRVVNQTGGTALPAAPPSNSMWAAETTTDVQAVRAMCSHCTILVVLAKNSVDANTNQAVDYAAKHAPIVSISYVAPESKHVTAADRSAYDHPGVAILAPAGDHGWYDWSYFNQDPSESYGQPSFPSTLGTVVGFAATPSQRERRPRRRFRR